MISAQGNVVREQAEALGSLSATESATGLHGQLVVYDLLRRLFLNGPSPELAKAIAAVDRTSLDLPRSVDQGLAQMQEAVNANLEHLATWSENMLVEFTRLMVGPGETPLVPYGSFYLSPTRSLMTEETLAVREFYLTAGMVVQNLNRVPDDHLGIELEFLYSMTQHAAEQTDEEGAVEERVRLLGLRDNFVRDHFSTWVPEFADKLDHATREPFFQAIATLLKSTGM